jgi:hypothetical protein
MMASGQHHFVCRDEAVEAKRRRAEAEALEREEKMEAMTRTVSIDAVSIASE